MRKQFRISRITPVGQNPGTFIALVFPLPLTPLKEHIERRIKGSTAACQLEWGGLFAQSVKIRAL
jgi:hypothetical protein